MFFLKYIFISSLFCVLFANEDDIDALLGNYQAEAELSKITKQESAGFLDIYTRNELEKMQVRSLEDVLKTIPNIYLTHTSGNFTTLTAPSASEIPFTSIRLYINDHDMTAASVGSAFMMWAKMPIEYIDHIEVYRVW